MSSRQTLKAAADIVVLVDISASMAPVLPVLRNAWVSFVRGLVEPGEPNGPQVDLRVKVVGYAMSEDGIQPFIHDNPFVHNDVVAFDAQLQHLKPLPTNDSPRPLLDALWRSGHSEWRDKKLSRHFVCVCSDSPYRERALLPEAESAGVPDIFSLFRANRILLYAYANEDPCYEMLSVYHPGKVSNGSLQNSVRLGQWQRHIWAEITGRVIHDPPLFWQDGLTPDGKRSSPDMGKPD